MESVDPKIIKSIANNQHASSNQSFSIQKDTQEKNIENKDYFRMSLIKRTNKVSLALHMVTELMSENEPLRNRLRTTALSLLQCVYRMENSGMNSREEQAAFVSYKEVRSLIEIAYVVKLLSQMNYEILKGEIESIMSAFSENISRESAQGIAVNLVSDFFVANDDDSSDGNVMQSLKDSVYSHDRKQSFFHKSTELSLARGLARNQATSPFKRTNMATVHQSHSTKPVSKNKEIVLKNNGAIKDNKSDRKEEIVAIIRKRGDVSIKDISMLITDCSEKTIQRELNALVVSGVLVRQGEKRWSRYLLR